ncbi:hypothetical protein [Curtanaerobium respiraculi]|uniref:hypothetical protein n=1 Tax=Curtanaerobium respiraculi TaxID=2949669 RepID=UPI0024B35C86|nr:hypothetical protein [Curtanaerobium respiraculi]
MAPAHGKHGKPGAHAAHARRRRPIGCIIAGIVAALLLAAVLAGTALFPNAARELADSLLPGAGISVPSETSASAPASRPSVSDPPAPRSSSPASTPPAGAKAPLKTAQIAACGDVAIRCPIEPASITGVLFHQASYDYALQMTTQLPAADAETCWSTNAIRVNNAQTDVSGWVDADALHLWRTGASTDMDTSIDTGAAAGTPVYAPVTGTVIKVCDYLLYDELPDIEIHIQPDGHPELDCVIIHTTDCQVTAGQRVEAGVTRISSIRDIASTISGVQLESFTEDGGNHVHVQVNDADAPGYRLKKLISAVLTGQETPEQAAAQHAAEEEARAAAEAAA